MLHKDIQAQGVLTEKGLIVKKGSEVVIHDLPSFPESLRTMKMVLIEEGRLIKKNDVLIFTKDTVFTSPSQAATMIAGYSINGKISWKFADNRTLKDLGY